MSENTPAVGNYCLFTDQEGPRIGRISNINKDNNSISVKYYYDGFTGYVTQDYPADKITCIGQPIGVNIPL